MLPRGFKADAERRALTLRSEMGLQPSDPVTAKSVAAHLRIGFRLADELVSREALEALDRLQPGCFSACTLPGPSGPVVITNPLNTSARQQSDAFHEISHLLLRHEMRRLERVADLVFYTCDAEDEEQADNLGATLLLPRPALAAAYSRGVGVAGLAQAYGVSEQLARWRLNASGVTLQVRRRQTLKDLGSTATTAGGRANGRDSGRR